MLPHRQLDPPRSQRLHHNPRILEMHFPRRLVGRHLEHSIRHRVEAFLPQPADQRHRGRNDEEFAVPRPSQAMAGWPGKEAPVPSRGRGNVLPSSAGSTLATGLHCAVMPPSVITISSVAMLCLDWMVMDGVEG